MFDVPNTWNFTSGGAQNQETGNDCDVISGLEVFIQTKDIIYLKLNNDGPKYQKKAINKKNSTWDALKLIRKQEITFFFSLPRDKSWENNKLIIDFGGQNDTENNKISILLLKRLTLEKTSENKSEMT